MSILGHELQRDEILYSEKDKLGQGAFGAVYRGKCRGVEVAIKVPCIVDEDQFEEFEQEIATMTAFSHPRLALFLGAAMPSPGSKEQIHLVIELLDGDMGEILDRDRKLKRLSLFVRLDWACQAAEGMAWLHGAQVLHRDLKPSNLLYDGKSQTVKVCDFGLAGLLGKNEVLEDGRMVGNPRYWAPEIINREPWSKPTDIYAWAVTCVTFITRKEVFVDYAQGDTMKMSFLEDVLENNVRPWLPAAEYKCPQCLTDLLEQCWLRDASKRPTFVEIIDSFANKVLLAAALPDENARKLWKEKTLQIKGPGLHREVRYADLSDTFAHDAASKEALKALGHAWMERAKYLLYKLLVSHWSAFGEEMSSLPHFGRIIGFFPPMGPTEDGTWMKRALDLAQQRWFWGDSSRMEIESLFEVYQVPVGTFVIRFANNYGFRLSIRSATITSSDENSSAGETTHFKIRHQYQSADFEIRHVPELAGQLCHSLRACAELVSNHLELELHDPPFGRLMPQ